MAKRQLHQQPANPYRHPGRPATCRQARQAQGFDYQYLTLLADKARYTFLNTTNSLSHKIILLPHHSHMRNPILVIVFALGDEAEPLIIPPQVRLGRNFDARSAV